MQCSTVFTVIVVYTLTKEIRINIINALQPGEVKVQCKLSVMYFWVSNLKIVSELFD